MKILCTLLVLLSCSVFICSCDSKFEQERNKWRESFANSSNTYFATDLGVKKQEALNRLLALQDEAEGKRLFPKSPDYLDYNRVFIYLRLCAIAYRHEDIPGANIYREKAAFYAARKNLRVFGGIDLGKASNLSIIVNDIESIDREFKRQTDAENTSQGK